MSTIAQSIPTSQSRVGVRLSSHRVASHFDYVLTYSTSILTSACGMAAFRLAHDNFGETGFAEFALMRRAIAFLVPLLSLGMAVAIAKRVASRAEDSHTKSFQFLGGGVLLALFSVSVFSSILFLFPEQISLVCTGATERAKLMQCVLPLTCGLILTICCSAYCRGRMWIGASNAMQLVCIGIIPTLTLLLVSDMHAFLLWSGYAVCAVSGSAIAVFYLGAGGAIGDLPVPAAITLFRFGAPRVPGDLAYYGLLAAPAIAAAHHAGVRSGGEVAYALTWITLIGHLVTPLSTVLLPEASHLIHAGQTHLLRKRLTRLLSFSVAVTCVLVGLLIYWAPALIELHLGDCPATLVYSTRLLLIAAIPLNFYICVRSVIDAGETRATSPAICIVALATFCIALLATYSHYRTAEAAVIAFIGAVSVLALLAGFATRRVFTKHETAASNGPVYRST